MSEEQAKSVTRVLRAVGDGDPEAARELLPLVYEEPRSLARARLRHPERRRISALGRQALRQSGFRFTLL